MPPVASSQHSVDSIELFVNGAPRRVAKGSMLLGLIGELGLRQNLVAVEINRELVRRSTFAERKLQSGDRIEIVEFVGGG